MDLFQVIRTSKIKSSLGDRSRLRKEVVFEFPKEEDATAKANFLNSTILPAEKDFLGTEFVVEKKEDKKN